MCVPPSWVGDLHHVVGAEGDDGFDAAFYAVLWLDVHGEADPVPDVLGDGGAAHLKGSPAHRDLTNGFGRDVESGG